MAIITTTEGQRKKMMTQLKKAWERQPNQRFGQLLLNTLARAADGHELFSISDDDLITMLKEWPV